MEEPPQSVLRAECGKDYTKRKVFVGGLNLETTEAELKEYLGQFGDIVELTIIKDKHSKRSRGFGFVTYRRKRVARQLLTTPLTLAGCRLELNLAEPKTPSKLGELKDTSGITKIFVGGLPKTSTNQDLLDCFSKYGPILEASIAEDKKTLQHRGFGFVVFHEAQSAQDVIRDYKLHTIQSKWVECKIALPKFVNESAKKPSDHIGTPLSESTESEIEEVPDLLGKIEKQDSMELVPELSHKVSQQTRSTVKRSQALQAGSGTILDSEKPLRDTNEAWMFAKSGNIEDLSRMERLNFTLGGIERCESRGVSKAGKNLGRGSKHFELLVNQEVHRSISIRPQAKGQETTNALNALENDVYHPKMSGNTSSNRLGQKKAKVIVETPKIDLGGSNQEIFTINKVTPKKETKARVKPDSKHTSIQNFDHEAKKKPPTSIRMQPVPSVQPSVAKTDVRYNYRYNKQTAKATQYWNLFQSRAKQKLLRSRETQPIPAVALRVNKADQPAQTPAEQPLQAQALKRQPDRSKSRFYTPFGQRDPSKVPNKRAFSINPMLSLDGSSAADLPAKVSLLVTSTPNSNRPEGRFDKTSHSLSTVKLKSESALESPHGPDQQALERAGVQSRPLVSHDAREELLQLPAASDPTIVDNGILQTKILEAMNEPISPAEETIDQRGPHVASARPAGLSSLAMEASCPLLGADIAEERNLEAVDNEVNKTPPPEVFPTPADLAEGFSWEDQFLTLKTLTGAEPVVFMGRSGTSKMNYSTPADESSDKTMLQTQIDLKLKRLRDNIATEHAEELERTKVTVKALIARKSKPMQRSSKDALAKIGQLDMN